MSSWAAADDNPFSDPSVSAARSGAGAAPGEGDNGPAWLRGGGGAAAASAVPPPPPPPVPQASGASVPAPSTHQAAAAARAPPSGEVPKLVLYMRVANVCLSVLLAATSAITLVTEPNISAGVLAIYLFMFACLICCFETHLKAVAKSIAANFGFLYNCKGRAVFLLFVGIICFSFTSPLGIVSGILMVVNAIFNFYVIFKHPEIEEQQQRKDLESDGREAITRAGSEYARNNPQQVGQAVRAAATYV